MIFDVKFPREALLRMGFRRCIATVLAQAILVSLAVTTAAVHHQSALAVGKPVVTVAGPQTHYSEAGMNEPLGWTIWGRGTVPQPIV